VGNTAHISNPIHSGPGSHWTREFSEPLVFSILWYHNTLHRTS